ncbi:QacA/B family quaternary ammonium compound efflux MFS transporter [Mammaliicoccus sciuri]|uniref:QacA/B family quaternary ammonium compound efflux MFS transporter n=1 Tax=Mammaliicoccus sciuri TaxID=1296 RepID=UPI002DB95E0A|nr:QacA/B family quaternary ammonium compound efflux MFS transporter [Mammaliicoccus sciuri]MEB6118604.1 QacA/B family quaternary ammonium compound efflux MFS transporter [Mammaliicoccus sciuri]
MVSFFTKTTDMMTSKKRWTALIVLAASLFVVMMDMTILIMALPDLVRELKPSATQQLWIVDIYSLVLAGFIIPLSDFADKWGRKKALLTGFALFGLVSLAIFFAESAEFVIAIRFLLGIAGALIMPTTLSMIRVIFEDPKERATALAVWSIVSSVGAVFGPIIGGALLEQFSWHSAFLINVPFALIAVVTGLFLLPESKVSKDKAHSWDIISTILSVAGMIGLVWSIKEFSKEGLTDIFPWAVIVLAVLMLILFVRRNLLSSNPMLDVRLFKKRSFSAGTIAAFMTMFAMASVLLLAAQWLQVVEELSPFKSGLYLLPMAIGAMVFAPIAPGLAARFGPKIVLPSGIGIAAIGMFIMYFFGHPLSYSTMAIALILVGAGTASLAVASALIMLETPTSKAGNAAAVEESMYDLGNVFGVAVLGSLSSYFYRIFLDISSFSSKGIVGELAHVAEDSVVGAVEVAKSTGIKQLASDTVTSFNDAFVATALVGGIIMIIISVVVYILIPKSLDITKQK